MGRHSPGELARRRANRRRNKGGTERPETYDGVSDDEIYLRDDWECRMPVCLCPDGRHISRLLRGAEDPSPWAPSIDHIVPQGKGGPDTAENKRAAHRRCNFAASRSLDLTVHPGSALLTEVGSRLPEEIVNRLRNARGIG